MNRRGFLGFFSGAAVSAPSLARAAAGDVILKQAGFASGNGVVGAAASQVTAESSWAPSNVAMKAVRWIKRKGIPEWKMHDLRRSADYQRANGLDPDLACLISVSPGWKARAQRKRNLEREIERSLASIGKHAARSAFAEKMRRQFGEGIDWYD